MEGFTLLDGGVALVVLISGVLAFSRGLVREILAILGWVVAAIAAYYLTPRAEPLIREIPVLNDFLEDSCELSIIAAFAVVFAIALVIVSIFTPLFSSAVRHSAAGGVDQALGFLFGILRGLVLVAIALVVYDRIFLSEPVAMIDDSRTAEIFADVQDRLNEQLPESAPQWITERYEDLVGPCGAAQPAAEN